MQYELRVRLRGEGEHKDIARKRKLKIIRAAEKRKVSEAEVIRNLIDSSL
jgi:hypothetical protein